MTHALRMTAAVLIVAGCSSGTGGGGGGGSGSGGGSGGTGGGSTPNINRGQTQLVQTATNTGWFSQGYASFYPSGIPPSTDSSGCTTRMTNGCKVTSCVPDGGQPESDAGTRISAGTVTAKIGSVPSVALDLQTYGGYVGTLQQNTAWWDGGEAVTVSASGSSDGGPPAFTANFTAPTRVAITVPAGTGTIAFTRGSAINVGWGGGTGELQVVLAADSMVPPFVDVSCTVQASSASFDIPGAVTQLMPLGAGYLYVQSSTKTLTSAGAWTIESSATSLSAVRATNAQ